jgi:predicted RNA binding protein YcfA (HicA-like mRNA interferase family)
MRTSVLLNAAPATRNQVPGANNRGSWRSFRLILEEQGALSEERIARKRTARCPKPRKRWRRLSATAGVEVRRSGSHRTLQKSGQSRTWAYHDGADLGNTQMARISKLFGYSLEELRKL